MSTVPDAASFLAGGGETGSLIARRDWSATPLGPIDSWPPSLKISLGLILHSPVPIVMLWGEDGIMLYNDAYSVFAGARHPDLLGSKVREGWPEVAEFNDNVMKVGLAGGTLAYRDQELTLHRSGEPEQVWMNLDYSPVIDESGKPAGVMAIVIETTHRVRAERSGRDSEERMRLALVAGKFTDWYWNAATDRIRFSPLAAENLDIPESFQPTSADIAALVPEPERAAVLAAGERGIETGEPYQIEYPMHRPDGSKVWIATYGQPVKDDAGKVIGVMGISQEITERKQAEEALRNSEESLRLAVEGAGMATWDLDLKTMQGHWSQTRFDILGYPRAEGSSGTLDQWFDRIVPEDLPAVGAAVESCFADGVPFTLDYRIHRADTGEERWLQSYGNRIEPEDGVSCRFVGVSFDITERKSAERRQRLLINELNHRVKNTLAIVQGIAHQSFRGDYTPEVARHAFEHRLAALSAAHNLLTQQNWEAAAIREVLASSLAAHGGGDRVTLDGPDLLLNPKNAVSLAMAVHELATNATKYGSLSVPGGTVAIEWSVADDRLKLVWRERGGPEVRVPQRRGFGTRMIERGLAAEFGGKVTIGFEPEGVVCTVDAPLPKAGGQ